MIVLKFWSAASIGRDANTLGARLQSRSGQCGWIEGRFLIGGEWQKLPKTDPPSMFGCRGQGAFGSRRSDASGGLAGPRGRQNSSPPHASGQSCRMAEKGVHEVLVPGLWCVRGAEPQCCTGHPMPSVVIDPSATLERNIPVETKSVCDIARRVGARSARRPSRTTVDELSGWYGIDQTTLCRGTSRFDC